MRVLSEFTCPRPGRVRKRGFALLAALALTLGACATPPSRINDVCAVFDQRDGWFDNWHSAAGKASAKHGIPVPVLMATIRKESGFKGNAKPPRTKLFGFIPWKRQSTAYGYSQALNGTWDQYQLETGSFAARRGSFADAVDFVGWYHEKSVDSLGIAPGDTYNLYLAYYLGWGAYSKGAWKGNPGIQRYARETATMAETYATQMRGCGR